MHAGRSGLGLVAVLLVGCGLAAVSAQGQPPAWPGWRGPAGNGQWADVPAEMPPVALLWKKPMAGPCSAGVSAAEGLVVVADGDNAKDYYRCYDAQTGKEVWAHSVPNGRKLDYGASPRATPWIHEGKVFCLGAFGDLHCLDLRTGKALWGKSHQGDFNAGEMPTWGHCTALCVADGKLIVHPRDVVALEPATGKVVWTGKSAGPNYSTFLEGTFGGVRQLIGYDARSISGWDLKTGNRLWSMKVDNSKGYIVPSPVAVGDKLLLTTEDEDTRLYAFDKEGKLVEAPEAENEDLCPEMATPTVQGELVLGICQGLICMDPRNKLKTLWIQEKEDAFFGLAHIVAGKERALVFGENGTMALVKADAKACTILGKVKLCDNTWTYPALMDGKLYIRDDKFFYCYRLGEKPAGKGAGNGAGEAR